MTTDHANDPWVSPPDDPAEAATRRRVGLLARVALVLALAGCAVGFTGPIERVTPRWFVALAALAVALLIAIFCVRHGAKHEHERGRGVAILTIVVCLGAGSFLLAAPYFVTRLPGLRR